MEPVSSSSSYDDLPYESRVLPFTHPISLATMATLYGASPPPVETCRVLEIGCATGDNLLSMAATLPKASFVGIDNSSREIEDGLRQLRTVGLPNVDLRCLSLMDVQPDCGTFDYILCHGVYSWVSPGVADHILSLYARHLSPQGIGYISYNTYPGWHIKAMIRDVLRYHVRAVSGVQQQVEAARKFLHALANSVPKHDEIYRKVLQDGAADMESYRNDYLFHEFLEDWNCPVYFHEFMERVTAKGLQYVGPAKFTQWEALLPADVKQMLSTIPNRIEREQYLDYFGNRTFRKSLLCRAENSVVESPSLAALQTFFVSTDLRPVSARADLGSSEPVQFRSSTQDEMTTNKPHVKLALHHLATHASRPVPFASIWPAIQPQLPAEGDPQCSPTSLAEALLQCFQGNLIEFLVADFPYVLEVSTQPCASPFARCQAMKSELAANLRHRLVRLSDFERIILTHLDGTRDRSALCRILSEAIERGDLDLVDKTGESVQDAGLREALIKQSLDPCLQQLAIYALLAG